MKPCFVFVVCGQANHVRELHAALAALRRHSRADILVVTDSRRNEIPVEWPDVVDVATPSHLDHHQASINLKTRVHRLVPPGRRYCYLDTDVFATSPDVDQIFTCRRTPVAFAADQVRLHRFSPYAVQCGCLERNRSEMSELDGLLQEAWVRHRAAHRAGGTGIELADFEARAARLIARLRTYIAHRRAPASPSQCGDPDAVRWGAFWFESQWSNLQVPEDVVGFVEQTTAWRYDRRRRSWISPAGNDAYHLHCDHLREAIAQTFGITVSSPRWQHWNGGVFLFDDRGHAFLDDWHAKTMRILDAPGWRTRDQGTLVATVWEHGLERQRLLPSRFNCILDPSVGTTMVSRSGDALTTDAFLTRVRPALAHVLGASSNAEWPVWRWVDARATGEVSRPSGDTTLPG